MRAEIVRGNVVVAANSGSKGRDVREETRREAEDNGRKSYKFGSGQVLAVGFLHLQHFIRLLVPSSLLPFLLRYLWLLLLCSASSVSFFASLSISVLLSYVNDYTYTMSLVKVVIPLSDRSCAI